MKVACTTNAWQVLKVATSITVGVVIIHKSGSVKRLMNITDVVDDESEGERSGVVLLREVVLDLLIVIAILVCSATI